MTQLPDTLGAMVDRYLDHARTYYRRSDGSPTGEANNQRSVLGRFLRRFGEGSGIETITRSEVRAWRNELAEEGLTRTYINRCLRYAQAVFVWMDEEELLTPDQYTAVEAAFRLPKLKPGRSKARESAPVEPVSDEILEAYVRVLPPVPKCVVQLLRLTGARIGELLSLRHGDITPDDDNPNLYWAIPTHHKSAHHGVSHRRWIPLSPKCFDILDREGLWRPLLPAEPLFPSQLRPGRAVRRDSVYTAIKRAAETAFPPPGDLARRQLPAAKGSGTRKETDAELAARLSPEQLDQRRRWIKGHCFHPHQIRHTVATKIRDHGSLDEGAALLGHKHISTTEIYAKLDRRKAAAALERIMK